MGTVFENLSGLGHAVLLNGLYSIDPSADFLAELARGASKALGDHFGAAIFLLPSRRACLEFRSKLIESCASGQTMELPLILPVGEADCLSVGLLPKEPLPPAIDPLERQLILTSLVKRQRQESGGITDEHALRLASDLAAMLDEFQTEEVPLERLKTLAPSEFAGHWQRIIDFLQILADVWPPVLKEMGKTDRYERRNMALDQLSAQWRTKPPDRPIIAAGMTGTVPAVARLLSAITKLPQGSIVLPGLDMTMEDKQWTAVGAAPTHPQFGLFQLLASIGVERSEVCSWPGRKISKTQEKRLDFIAEMLRPASTSDLWRHSARPDHAAISAISVVEFDDQQDEARALLLMIREQLEHPERRVSLVTSDRTLARAVTHELRMTGIDAADSSGTPLDQSPPGSLIILAARALVERWSPLSTLALLKHPLVSMGHDRAVFRRLVRRLELKAMHGPRLADGLQGIRHAISTAKNAELEVTDPANDNTPVSLALDIDADASDTDDTALLSMLDALIDRTAQIDAWPMRGDLPLPAMLEQHTAFCSWLCHDLEGSDTELWSKATGRSVLQLLERLQAASVYLPVVGVDAFPVILALVMSAETVRDERPGDSRVAILGELESRLNAADKVLIAGLREGVWPRTPDPSPWLNRAMRQEVGLPPIEARIGMAAHDFAMNLARPEVSLTVSRKDWQGSPAPVSRWLSRLRTFLQAHEMSDAVVADEPWTGWAHLLVKPAPVIAPSVRPAPRPPVVSRPRTLSVTDVELLVSDPYMFYAAKILRLQPLDPIDADPGAAERGMVIHAALERFVQQTSDGWPDDPLAMLVEIGQEIFAEFRHQPQIHAIWWPRFLSVASWFVEQEAERRQTIARVMVELRGEIELRAASGPIRLRARADRVELGLDGRVTLIDYKTGRAPDQKSVRLGQKPQLSLSGLIAQEGGFREVGRNLPDALDYWSVAGGNNNAIEPRIDVDNRERLISQAREGLIGLIDHFNNDKAGYPAIPKPEIARFFDEFEHLARIEEWRGLEQGGTDQDIVAPAIGQSDA